MIKSGRVRIIVLAVFAIGISTGAYVATQGLPELVE
jgi:hypothetical protein